jgi:hypothetical protein
MEMKSNKEIKKYTPLFCQIPPIIKAKGGRAGRRYREARYLNKVRRIKMTINQMKKKDSPECQNSIRCFQR